MPGRYFPKATRISPVPARRAPEVTEIEMDGGANESNVDMIAEAGANVIVSGSCAFNSPTPENVLAVFRGAGERRK